MKGGSRRGVLLFLETVIFSVIVPGAVVLWIPRDVLGIWGQTSPTSWSVRHVVAAVPLLLGLGIYLRCLWEFAARGRGIPAPVDHPKETRGHWPLSIRQKPDVCRRDAVFAGRSVVLW